MAIKFSELRGLIKDTNINTVRMSNPVYFNTLYAIIHGFMATSFNSRVSFSRINMWKQNDELYRIKYYYPLTYNINFIFNSNDFANNISLQYNKEMWVNDFNYIRNTERDRLMKWNYGLDIFSCYQTNDNTVYKNLSLVKVICSHKNVNQIINIPIMLWRDGKWINESYYKSDTITAGFSTLKQNYYKDIIVDFDPNINSSVLLYTDQFSFRGDGQLVFSYAYKGNDNINQLYNKIIIEHGSHTDFKRNISNRRLNITNNKEYFERISPPYPYFR